MAIKISGNTVIYDDEVLRVSAANTSSRPVSAVVGMLRFNTETTSFEGYNGTEWTAVGGGGGADEFARTIAMLGY